MFVDTHCHLNILVDKKPDELITEEHLKVIASSVVQAERNGVKKIINVGTSLAETQNSIVIAQRFANIWASAGIHPCDCAQHWHRDFKEIEILVRRREENKIIAIGETGLDFYHKPFDKQRQTDAFKAHIELALEYDLPLIVHVRESADEVLHTLEQYKKESRGVIHCFMQEKYVADTVIEWGWFLGIDGPITYPKNEWFRDLIKLLPVEHFVFETDTPFLPPQQRRGKKNEPATIPLFAQTVADLHEMSLQEIGEVTTRNVQKLFGI